MTLRQFDFWLGEWCVSGAPGTPEAGRLLGHNRIESVSAGRALAEHWRGSSGLEGRSLSAWDADAACWRQFWIGADGVLLQLTGGWDGRCMRLGGSLRGADGRLQAQRIEWTPQPDGSVLQCWNTSDDDGAHWRPAFAGVYRRAAA